MSRLYKVLVCCHVMVLVAVCWVPNGVFAAESLSVAVTPPLFQLTIGPGESWTSAIKIVNTNDRDVTYYATPVDFEATGEKGQGTFVPLVNSEDIGTDTGSLGNWIEISSEPVTVRRSSSKEIPFT